MCAPRGPLASQSRAEVEDSESGGDRSGSVQRTRHSEEGWYQADRDQQERGDHNAPGGRLAIRIDDGQHADAAAGIVIPIHPGDGVEVGKLPRMSIRNTTSAGV